MVKTLLNTLYVTSDNAYLSLDGENVVLLQAQTELGRVPLHNLEGIVCFGYRGVSPSLMGACVQRNVGLCFLTPHGRFLARVSGPVNGNVLLRTEQYRRADAALQTPELAKMFLTGKIYNCRWCLERAKRDHPMRVDQNKINNSVQQLKNSLELVRQADTADELLGIEGNAAKAYFASFDQMILREEETFRFGGRSRRPPMDPLNALLSFTYSLLGNEIAGALETVGLDPCVGFMHRLRPGRSSLALDLLEELRAPLADRFVISQINLGTIKKEDFSQKENGAFFLKDDARKRFLAAWVKKKQEQLVHPYLKEKITWGLAAYSQAMLLARFLRGDLDAYPPFLWK